ncbi:MAG: RNA polymerase sigma factor [Rhodothermales bacterium]
MDMTDEQLMEAVGQGNQVALGQLFDRHHASVFRQCLGLVGNRQDAEDLVQDVFLRVWRYAGSYNGTAAVTTWMYRLVRNACLDHLQRGARLRAVDLDATAHETSRSAVTPDPILDSTHNAAGLLERLLCGLSYDQREIIVLNRYMDMEYPEIAAALGITVNAARVRLHRALQELRTRYEEVTA